MIAFNQDYSAIFVTFCFLQLHRNCSESRIWAKTYIDAILTNWIKHGNIIKRVGAYLESDVNRVVYRSNISNTCIWIIPVCRRCRISLKIQSFKAGDPSVSGIDRLSDFLQL